MDAKPGWNSDLAGIQHHHHQPSLVFRIPNMKYREHWNIFFWKEKIISFQRQICFSVIFAHFCPHFSGGFGAQSCIDSYLIFLFGFDLPKSMSHVFSHLQSLWFQDGGDNKCVRRVMWLWDCLLEAEHLVFIYTEKTWDGGKRNGLFLVIVVRVWDCSLLKWTRKTWDGGNRNDFGNSGNCSKGLFIYYVISDGGGHPVLDV